MEPPEDQTSEAIPAEAQETELPTDRSFLLLSAEKFDGPIPHPSILKGYNDVVPGAAERILAMAEKTRHIPMLSIIALIATKYTKKFLGCGWVFY